MSNAQFEGLLAQWAEVAGRSLFEGLIAQYEILDLPPSHNPDPANLSGTENQALVGQTVVVSDDISNLTLALNDVAWPAFVTPVITNNGTQSVTLELTGTPTYSDSGIYTRSYRATGDPAGNYDFNVQLTITNVNRAPVCSATYLSYTGYVNSPIDECGVLSVDLDLQNLTLYRIGGKPSWLTESEVLPWASAHTGPLLLNGTPDAVGVYQAQYRCYDGTDYSNTITIQWTIVERPADGIGFSRGIRHKFSRRGVRRSLR